MRDLPNLWKGPLQVQWACALIELVEPNGKALSPIPMLLSGFHAITQNPTDTRIAQAIRTARQLIPHYTTERAVKNAVQMFQEHCAREGITGSYHIDAESLRFERLSEIYDQDVEVAQKALCAPLPYRQVERQLADPSRDMHVRLFSDERAPSMVIPGINTPLPLPNTHPATQPSVAPMVIPWDALLDVSRELDVDDAQHPERKPRHWEATLRGCRLLAPAGGHLEAHDTLTLDGLKHLIGLPGVGKTTLLIVLGIYLDRHNYRVMFFFPSIEIARQHLEQFHRYGVDAGMLVGQSPQTRARHAAQIAEAIAAQGDGGFGHTLVGADRFAHPCVLPAFSASQTRDEWQLEDAPCEDIRQLDRASNRFVKRLCPVWTCCGRNKGPRELTSARIWVGHVLSADTTIPAHASTELRQYFELLADTFDLVVFDEADMTQALLDQHGSASIGLTGSEESVHRIMQSQVLTPLAGSANYRLRDPSTANFARLLMEFSIHNTTLIHILHHISEDTGKQFAMQLLTTNRVIYALVRSQGLNRQKPPAATSRRSEEERAQGLTRLWDDCLYAAFYDRIGIEKPCPEDRDIEYCANRLHMSVRIVKQRARCLTNFFRIYLAEDTITGRLAKIDDIHNVFIKTVFPNQNRPSNALDVVQLLTALSFMILTFRKLTLAGRNHAPHELLQDAGLSLDRSASKTLQLMVPVNILGALSGVWYQYRSTPNIGKAESINVRYLVLTSTPRMLMYHLHELSESGRMGPHVLLTSATSFLELSPAYHVPCGPHYVLSPARPMYDASASEYIFRFVLHPQTYQPLRYSGAGPAAARNLELMVEGLVQGGLERSEIVLQIRDLEDKHGVRRKVAFVVNSYAQVRQLMRYLGRRHPQIAYRTRGVVRKLEEGERYDQFVTPAMVESLGDDPQVDCLIFPMLALGRAVNVVFRHGPHAQKAAVGILYFLTRPHPGLDDLNFFFSVAARATQEFDAHPFLPDAPLQEMHQAWMDKRRETFRYVARLLQEPVQASRLGNKLLPAFTANTMVQVLQTIGRAMRGGMPVRVFFVDAAWAPNTAEDKPDTERSSMLVMMRAILESCLSHPDGAIREIYHELYAAFLEPMRRLNLNTTGMPSPPSVDEDLDGVEPSRMLFEDPDEFMRAVAPESV